MMKGVSEVRKATANSKANLKLLGLLVDQLKSGKLDQQQID